MPYMNIVSKSTPIMRLNLENIAGRQKAVLTIKGHQTNCWTQIGKSVKDAFEEYQENEYLIYRKYVLCFTFVFEKLIVSL